MITSESFDNGGAKPGIKPKKAKKEVPPEVLPVPEPVVEVPLPKEAPIVEDMDSFIYDDKEGTRPGNRFNRRGQRAKGSGYR